MKSRNKSRLTDLVCLLRNKSLLKDWVSLADWVSLRNNLYLKTESKEIILCWLTGSICKEINLYRKTESLLLTVSTKMHLLDPKTRLKQLTRKREQKRARQREQWFSVLKLIFEWLICDLFQTLFMRSFIFKNGYWKFDLLWRNWKN